MDPVVSLILVSGLSGAGRSTALKILEDIGYDAVDNLPFSSLEQLTGEEEDEVEWPEHFRAIAIGIDIRTRGFTPAKLLQFLAGQRAAGRKLKLLYLDCQDEVLRRRFTETRRSHPLALHQPVTQAISDERALLGPLQAEADLMIDTSELTPAELRQLLQGHFPAAKTPGTEARPRLAISVMSFSYRYGLPREADLVFDARFLRNPYYNRQLRPRTGQDADVGAYIAADPAFADFFRHLTAFLLPLLPRYQAEGKSYLTLAVGCTGGRHRSVYIAEQLTEILKKAGWDIHIRHRDLKRNEAVRDGVDRSA